MRVASTIKKLLGNKQIKQYPHKTACRNCGFVDVMNRDNLDLSQMICTKCHKSGTTVYIKVRSKAMPKKKWKQDDRVVVDFEGEPFTGSIAELTKTKARVLFDDGDVEDIKLRDLKSEAMEKFTPLGPTDKGFHQYDIEWDKETINFKFKAEEGKFYGWWRKVRVGAEGKIAYGIDILVEYKSHRYNVKTLLYFNNDPRGDLQSLDADICAAANKWFYSKCQGTFDTIEDLQQRAAKPTIMIRQLETLDRIILRLKEYRDTSIKCGGLRIMTFTGDTPEKDPSMRIEIDLTTQALGYKGRAPSLFAGAVLDRVAKDSSKKSQGRSEPIKAVPDSKNVQTLVQKLQSSKDKVERRKIRATLRRMGHKGGARSSK